MATRKKAQKKQTGNRSPEIHLIRIEDLKPASYNPRKWPENDRADLRASLSKFGFVDPVIVNQHPKRRDIEVGDLMEWGFQEDDLAGAFEFDTPEGLTDPDEVPEPPEDPITKPGDLWILGDHRLLCGDSTNAEDVARVMGGEKADLCFTSPPYGQQRDYTDDSDCTDWDSLMNGVFANVPEKENTQVLVNLGLIHRDCEWIPYWDKWVEWMRSKGWRRFGFYVWDQGWGLPGDWAGRLAPSHELVFHFNRKPRKPSKFVDSKMGGQTTEGKKGLRGKDGKVSEFSQAVGPNSEYTYPDKKIPDSVIRENRQCGGVGHVAPFSVNFASHVIAAWPGIIYEPFCGSGSTLIAAETHGSHCMAMEIAPQYCDVIVKRWEDFTGKKAVLEK